MQEIEHPQDQKSILTVGAGQLGLLLSKAAKQLGINFEYCTIADSWISLDGLKDPSQIIVTFEQEHVDELLGTIEMVIGWAHDTKNIETKPDPRKWLRRDLVPAQ